MSGFVSPFDNKLNDSDLIYLGNPAGISAYADQQTDAANAYLLRLGDATASLAAPTIQPIFPSGPSAPALEVTTPPSFEPVVWTAPNAPSDFIADLNIDNLLPEPFDDEPPALVFPAAPTFAELPPDAPSVDTSYVMPTLNLQLPAPPDLLSISITNFSGVTIPTIDFVIPELNVVEPSIREYVPGALYTSTLLSALQASLLERITDGGTGLAPDVENAIWDRGREREARSARLAHDELERMEAMGFALPPGTYLDAKLKIATETDAALKGHSREVMIKQAELEQSNVNNALQLAVTLEGNLISYSNQVEQRLFESCRYATEAGIAIYNAKVQAYAAYVDAYKAKVQIYEAQVRAELAKVEVYKAQVDAELAKAQVNTALVQSYRAQVDAALANVEVFKAEIGAIQAKADIERTKVMIYGEQVRGYSAQVNAYTAGVEGFRAVVQAEGAKQEAFRSKVDAYTAQVTAQVKVVDARISRYTAQLEAYKARWDGYRSAFQAESARAQAIAANNSSTAEGYKATVQGVTSYNDVLTKQWQVALDQAQRVADIGINAAKANAELYITTRSLALDAAKVGAQVSAQLGAAAINAINWSTSFSNANSFSTSFGTSQSWSSSDSESTSTNYNYSYSV